MINFRGISLIYENLIYLHKYENWNHTRLKLEKSTRKDLKWCILNGERGGKKVFAQ